LEEVFRKKSTGIIGWGITPKHFSGGGSDMNVPRTSVFRLAAISMIAMAALAACAPAPTPAPTAAPPTAAAASITLTFGPGRDGDQTPGTAVLTSQGDKTLVVLNLKSGGAGVSQPAHIHDGACPGVLGVKYPLTNVVDGTSTTVVSATLASLLTGNYGINVHKSTSEIGVYVACAAVK
jgi:hypothetical protein